MPTKKIKVASFACLGFCLNLFLAHPAKAHKSSHHSHKNFEEITLEEREAEELRQLLDDAHHTIEDEHEDAPLAERYIDQYNLKKTALEAYRWYSMHRKVPHVGNAAANVAALLVVSHTFETALGAGLVSLGATEDWDGLTRLATATLGVTITVPGLDPVCLILVGAYGKWPRAMNRLLTAPRLFVAKAAELARRAGGIPEGYFQFQLEDWQRRRFTKLLSSQGERVMTLKTRRGAAFTIFDPNGPGQLEIKMIEDPETGVLALASATFSREPLSRQALAAALKPFGINIRSALLDLQDKLTHESKKEIEHITYIDKVQTKRQSGDKVVVFNRLAFPFLRLNKKDLDCTCALRGNCNSPAN